MRKIILILLALIFISCEHDNQPVQEVTKTTSVSDLVVFGKYEDWGGLDASHTQFYMLTTRYQDCRISDCGTYHYIDSLIPIRRQDVIQLQREYDSLNKKVNR